LKELQEVWRIGIHHIQNESRLSMAVPEWEDQKKLWNRQKSTKKANGKVKTEDAQSLR
jgi:hypothetical protein